MKDTYNLATTEGFFLAFNRFNSLKEKGATIEINEIKPTRSTLQNRALHLYFTFCADALNDAGFEFAYRNIKGMEIEIPWNGEMFKEYVWRPIQKTLYDFESTTKLNTTQINAILDVLTRHFANLGLSVQFPNQFDYWLKKVGY